jgi:sec-independent protein translocase protein TatC
VTTLPVSPKHSSAAKPDLAARDVPRPALDHLEELRWRILTSLLVLATATAIGWFYVDRALFWLAQPVGAFVFTSPAEAFLVRLKVAAGLGAFATFPFFLFQAWRFVEIALELRERTLIRAILPASCLLFYTGMALALFGVVPVAARFLIDFGGPYLRPMISFGAYLSFVIWMILGFGLFFQLPLGIVALSRAGIVNPWKLKLYRKHAVVFILVAAALLTPGPDIVSQMILALPSYLLFEGSLIIARRVSPLRRSAG